jgi:hypothetical protein
MTRPYLVLVACLGGMVRPGGGVPVVVGVPNPLPLSASCFPTGIVLWYVYCWGKYWLLLLFLLQWFPGGHDRVEATQRLGHGFSAVIQHHGCRDRMLPAATQRHGRMVRTIRCFQG